MKCNFWLLHCWPQSSLQTFKSNWKRMWLTTDRFEASRFKRVGLIELSWFIIGRAAFQKFKIQIFRTKTIRRIDYRPFRIRLWDLMPNRISWLLNSPSAEGVYAMVDHIQWIYWIYYIHWCNLISYSNWTIKLNRFRTGDADHLWHGLLNPKILVSPCFFRLKDGQN